jgi:integrase
VGKKKGETVSPETVKKDLRTIRAALGQAKRWKYLDTVPEMPVIDGFGRDNPFVTEQDFDAIMGTCDTARLPADQHFTAGEFWAGLLATAWVTGMRKSALLCLLWEDVDLDTGIAISRHHDNKQKREQRHQVAAAVPFLRLLHNVRKPGENRVFPWNHNERSLDRDLRRIQEAAKIHLPCRENHEHTPQCHVYGFHSFRYAHATYNFGRVPDRDLQQQMGHACFTTTQRYIKYAEVHQDKTYDVYLPKSLKAKSG